MRSVTFTPMATACADLERRDRLLARVVTIAFWPAIAVRSFCAAWIFLPSEAAFARADVQHDLVDLRNLQRVRVAELLHQFGLA